MDALYVKIRGRVHGPFDEEKLRSMIQKGKLSRIHQVSIDNQNWSKAGDYPELFVSNYGGEPPSRNEEEYAEEAETDNYASHSVPAPYPDQPAPIAAEWYYGEGADPIGPMSSAEIHSLFNSGTINSKTLVWREGLADWAPLSNYNELIPQESISVQPNGSNRNYSGSTQAVAGEVDPAQARALAASRGWMLLVSISVLVYGILAIVGGAYWLIQGIKYEFPLFTIYGISAIIWGGVLVTACVFIFSIAGKIYQLKFRPSNGVMLSILDGYRKLWLFLGIIAIIAIAYTLLLIFLAIAFAQSAGF